MMSDDLSRPQTDQLSVPDNNSATSVIEASLLRPEEPLSEIPSSPEIEFAGEVVHDTTMTTDTLTSIPAEEEAPQVAASTTIPEALSETEPSVIAEETQGATFSEAPKGESAPEQSAAIEEPVAPAESAQGELVSQLEEVELSAASEPSNSQEVVVPVTSEVHPVTVADDAMLFEQALAQMDAGEESSGEGSYKKLTKGDRVEATVIQVEKDRVFVDLGTKSEGIVPLSELSEEVLETAEGYVQIGDKIQVVVLRPDSAEGNPIVSKKRADFDVTWSRILETFEQGSIITAQVVDRVKGGLLVDIGVRGFVPATHVGSGKLRNIEKYLGQALNLKIIEIDRDRKKVVLSNRMAEDERREQVKKDIFEKIQPGDTLEGVVHRLTDYGAFVDVGGIDGLLHISEMSWSRINHPKEVLKEGQKIKVMVLRLDPSVSKISLGLRQVLPDPWNLIRDNYRVGQKIACKISRVVQNGAFVKLPEGAEAWLPASEISHRRVRPSEVLSDGQDVELSIIDLRPDERRMVLSLRGGSLPEHAMRPPGSGGGEYRDFDDRGDRDRRNKKKKKGGSRVQDEDFDQPIVGRVPTGGATIGERLGMLKGLLRNEDEDDDLDEPAAELESPTMETPQVDTPKESETLQIQESNQAEEVTEKPVEPVAEAAQEPVEEEPEPQSSAPTAEAEEPEKSGDVN